MKQTIIFPGSFDPVHNGHTNLACQVSQFEWVDEVWMMPSRRNPLKGHSVYASDADRLAMLRLATEGIKGVSVSDIEFSLPYPSYTIRTLQELTNRYPDRLFRLLIGSDNWLSFHKWLRAEEILQNFGVVIYPRPGYDVDIPVKFKANATLLDEAPVFPYSSTQVREHIYGKKNIADILSTKVIDYIAKKQLYALRAEGESSPYKHT